MILLSDLVGSSSLLVLWRGLRLTGRLIPGSNLGETEMGQDEEKL